MMVSLPVFASSYPSFSSSAERALDTLNFTTIKNKACRIMWSQRDPTVRKNGAGNLFVKNLDKTVDNRALHDTFSLFGNILSCKVVTDENGKSKGYGFVHFELDESAQEAVKRVNGMKIGSKEVYVGPFHKRNERVSGKPEHFTNIYVRSFPKAWTEEKLRSLFAQYGEITSLWLHADKHGRPFACINYTDGGAARSAVTQLNGRKVNNEGVMKEEPVNTESTEDPASTAEDKKADGEKTGSEEDVVMTLYVDRAQDKAERGTQLKQRFDNRQMQYRQKFEGVNLYIKNLSEKVNDAGLRQMFEKFGTITSAKVMRDEEGHSKGFGFVCFTSTEEATKAISEMHLKVCDQKPLYVGLAEQKDRRHARLQHHFRGHGRPTNPHPPAYGPSSMYYGGPGMNGMMPPAHGPAGAPLVWPPPPFPQQPPANMIWKAPPPMFGQMPPMGNGPMPNGHMPTGPMGNGPMPNGPMPAGPMPPQMASMMFPPGGQPGFRGGPAHPSRSMMRAVDPPSAANMRVMQPAPTSTANMQKQVLGERLFPLVSKHQPQLAGKITGMMLDMDDTELLGLIASEDELKAKIAEALRVLEQAAHHNLS